MGRAHRRRRVAVYMADLMGGRYPSACRPQRARRECGVFDVVVEYGRWRNALMLDCHKLAVALRTQRYPLDGGRLVPRHRIHLRPRELDADGPTNCLGGDRSHQGVRPYIGFPPEPPTEE